jgi:hypothetical protein
MSAWCAEDALFLPALLGQIATVPPGTRAGDVIDCPN